MFLRVTASDVAADEEAAAEVPEAIEEAKPRIFRDDWLQQIFDPASISASVESIVR